MCVCVCSVIYSEARSASSCPNGVPMTLTAADLHHRKSEEERETERVVLFSFFGGGDGGRRYGRWKSQHHFQSAYSI